MRGRSCEVSLLSAMVKLIQMMEAIFDYLNPVGGSDGAQQMASGYIKWCSWALNPLSSILFM